jgi:hypothetical protein
MLSRQTATMKVQVAMKREGSVIPGASKSIEIGSRLNF